MGTNEDVGNSSGLSPRNFFSPRSFGSNPGEELVYGMSIDEEARALEVQAEFEQGMQALVVEQHGRVRCCFCPHLQDFQDLTDLYHHTLQPSHTLPAGYVLGRLQGGKRDASVGVVLPQLVPGTGGVAAAAEEAVVNPPVVVLCNYKTAVTHKVGTEATLTELLQAANVEAEVQTLVRNWLVHRDASHRPSGFVLLQFERVTPARIHGFLAAQRLVRVFNRTSKGNQVMAHSMDAYSYLAKPRDLEHLDPNMKRIEWRAEPSSILQRDPLGSARHSQGGAFNLGGLNWENVCWVNFDCGRSMFDSWVEMLSPRTAVHVTTGIDSTRVEESK